MNKVAPRQSGAPDLEEVIPLKNAPWRGGQRRSVAALIVILLALVVAVPSASAATGHRHRRHIEHFLALSSDPSQNAKPIVIAWGPIHAKGVDTVLSATRDKFTFPQGSLFVTHHVNKRSIKDSGDPVTCYQTHTERGTYRVTGGTGAYTHARGHGHYSVRVAAVGCAQNAPPEFFSLKIRAAGPLHPQG